MHERFSDLRAIVIVQSLLRDGGVQFDLTIQKRWFNEGKDKMNYVRTLVFPLQKAGQFNSQIRQLKVYNYWVND